MYSPSFRTKHNSVPILSKKELEVIGENFVRDFCPEALKNPQAIDIEGFVECYLGMTIDYQYLSNDGRYLGMTVFNDTDKVIIYDPMHNRADYLHADARTVIIDSSLVEDHTVASQRHRYRYTMGHESGHDIFHSAYYYYDPMQINMFDSFGEERVPMVQCRTNSFAQSTESGSRKLWSDGDWMEWQANYFSSVLLMPQTAVRMLADAYRKKNFSDALIIKGVVDTFDVSLEAATYRCLELGLVKKDMHPRKVQSFLDFIDLVS